MRKARLFSNFHGRGAARAVPALVLVMALVTSGCTTNRMPGNGNPASGRAGVRVIPTASPSGGSELPPPMTSSTTSSTRLSTPLRVTPRSIHALSIDNGAPMVRGTLAGMRVLGPSNPNPAPGASSSGMVTGQIVNSAMITNPQQTVNATISSDPTSVVSSRDAAVATASAVFPTVPSTLTIGPAGASLTPGMAAATANAMLMTPTIAESGLALSNAARTTTLRPAAARAPGAATTTVTSPVRLVTGDAGRIVVTNASGQ